MDADKFPSIPFQGLETYTPRLVAIDARGSLGAVKVAGSLYDNPSSTDTTLLFSWKGKLSKHVSEPEIKNEFLQSLEQEELDWVTSQQTSTSRDLKEKSSSVESRDEHKILQNLEDTVQYWTDYSKVHFHPLSLFELDGVWHGTTPFDDYGNGRDILSGYMKDDALDRVRFFVEEADHMQGLQVLVDDSNGFAAVSDEFLEAVHDEYDKSPILLFTAHPPPLRSPATLFESVVRRIHDAVSFSAIVSSSSSVIPFSLSSFAKLSRYLQVNDAKNFHTSAVYASAMSCMTLPLRMDLSEAHSVAIDKVCGAMDMGDLIYVLSGRLGRRVSASEIAMPAPLIPGIERTEPLDSSWFESLIQDIIKTDDQVASEAVVVQGALSADSKLPAPIHDVVNCFPRKDKQFFQLSASPCPLAVPLPFPDIFGPAKQSKAWISDFTSISVATKLSTSISVLPYLEERVLSFQNPGGSSLGWQVLEGWGLQKDDVKELCEEMSNVVSAYRDKSWDSASDSE
ncbi:hypothetical protein KP509_1Z088900 [Ceratopteris richardii]|nr:hypothetical protein KP509_1Z088900 [Ceratopteris richardii]